MIKYFSPGSKISSDCKIGRTTKFVDAVGKKIIIHKLKLKLMANAKYNPVGWFEIYVDDISRAKKFYEEVFQVQLSPLADPTDGSNGSMLMEAFPMTMEDIPGASGALVQMQGVKAGGGNTIVYFTSLDCSVEEARVEVAGGKVDQSKMAIGEHGFITLCVDTEGNMFGIHSMK